MFLSASVQRNTNVNSDDFWYTDIGGATDSGVRMSTLAAMQCSVFYACDRVLSETMAQLPLFAYERWDDGLGRERAVNSDIAPLLHDQPNENMTSFTFRALMQHWINVRGNAYAEIIYLPNGRIDALIPLHPDRITIQLMQDRSVRYVYNDPFTGKQRIILSFDMFHVRGYSDDGIVGLNPIRVQRNTIANNIAGHQFDGRFFMNDAQTPGVVSLEGKFGDSDDRMEWLKGWKKRHQGKKQHSIELLEFGMKYQSTGMSYLDSQFLEMMRYRDEDVARIMKVQQSKVGIMSKSSFKNMEEQSIDFVQNTIVPIAVNWEQEIKRSLIIDDRIFAEFLVEALLRGNVAAQTEAGSKAIFAGWRNRNEQRQLENRNPAEGLDEFLEPQNTRSANESGGGNGANNNASAPTDRERRLALKAAERIVNKSIKATRKAYGKFMCGSEGPDHLAMQNWTKEFYADHAEFVSDCLVTDKITSERISTGSMNATIGAVIAEAHGHEGMVENLMTDWEHDRSEQLANTGVYDNA